MQVHRVILEVGERAPRVPTDTAAVPLEMTVRGTLVDDLAEPGEEVTVETPAGRRLRGRLVGREPAYDIGLGPPAGVPAAAGPELRKILRGEVTDREKA